MKKWKIKKWIKMGSVEERVIFDRLCQGKVPTGFVGRIGLCRGAHDAEDARPPSAIAEGRGGSCVGFVPRDQCPVARAHWGGSSRGSSRSGRVFSRLLGTRGKTCGGRNAGVLHVGSRRRSPDGPLCCRSDWCALSASSYSFLTFHVDLIQELINQSMIRWISQSIHFSVNQSMNETISAEVAQSINQSIG